MIVLFGPLQLMFNVVHILGFDVSRGIETYHHHKYHFSTLQLSGNVSDLALQAVLFGGHLSETRPFSL